ncbi:MAG: Fic family protein [Elusimicrobia bacterium]|nr:Fic family protein [Elusimicrobiota bacterium]
MKSLDAPYLNYLRLFSSQASTIQKIGEFRGKQELFTKQTPEILETLKQASMIESSESSNRIEGVTAPHERIEALVLKSSQPQNRPEQEIAGYRDALNLIHENAVHMEFSVNTVLQLHSLIFRHAPTEGGHWKITDNQILERSPDGAVKVRFTPVSAIATPDYMDSLTRLYKEAVDIHQMEPLIVVPLAILDFLCVHPFKDGNGRVSRLLTLLLLYRYDYQVGRYISLERIFEESKETYYETLKKSSQGWFEGKHDAMPWMNYFWGVIIKAYREFEERVGTIRTSRGSKTDQIKKAIKRKIGPFSISDIEGTCPGISRDMIRNVLRQLRDSGFIVPQGKGRGAKWIKNKKE